MNIKQNNLFLEPTYCNISSDYYVKTTLLTTFTRMVKKVSYSRVDVKVNGCLYLKSSSGVVYQCEMSINIASIRDGFQSIWDLYNELKNVETPKERETIVKLYKKDETILQPKKEIANFSYANALLEKERDMYKSLPDDIQKPLLNGNK